MDVFIKSAAVVMVALVIGSILSGQSKDIALLFTMVVCSMLLLVAVSRLETVVGFFEKLQEIGQLDETMLQILLKALGIGLLGEITSQLCTDGGFAAFGKTIRLLASCIILWLSIPLFEALLELIEEILDFV